MIKPRIIPCLLLKDKGLVKTIKFKDPRYIGDPINAVWIFNKKEADELIFLDITATKEKRIPSIELISKLSDECFMPLTVGGGIRTTDDIKKLLNAGAEKVTINTHAIEDPTFIKKSSKIFGSQSIIVAIDVKKNWNEKYNVFIKGGSKGTGKNPIEIAKEMEKMGAGEIFLNSIDCDGTMNGYDISLIRKVSDVVNIPVIASGGAGNLEHIIAVIHEGHAAAAAAGSLFIYHGKKRAVLINYPDKDELENFF